MADRAIPRGQDQPCAAPPGTRARNGERSPAPVRPAQGGAGPDQAAPVADPPCEERCLRMEQIADGWEQPAIPLR